MRFGGHMSAAGGLATAIDRIEAIGGDCVQLFTQSPRMWRPTAHTPEAIELFRTRRAEAGIDGVVCHALYLVNLAASDDLVYEKSITAMRATMDTANAIGADAVIFHVGSHLGAGPEAGHERVVAALRQILERADGSTWLLMENSAATTRSCPASGPAPRCEPTWKMTASASIAFAVSIVARIAVIDFS